MTKIIFLEKHTHIQKWPDVKEDNVKIEARIYVLFTSEGKNHYNY